MTRNVSCPGKWVLYSALQRTEAGAFFALGAKPRETKVSNSPWLIRVWDGEADDDMEIPMEQEAEKENLPPEILEKIHRQLSFRYAHTAATVTPSKQTATQRKGRVKDQEASEQAQEPKQIQRNWRKPEFIARAHRGTTYGSAVHAVLQYIRYEACADTDGVKNEIRRLVEERFITPEQGAMVEPAAMAEFFQTPLGSKLRTSQQVLREFKFSILDDASQYGDGLEGEHVLLQGVVDCALIEPDGITIVDFKTDYVTKDTIDEITQRYRPQVETYADALCRIFGLPIKEKALYYFHIGDFRWL
jgi:ATP-dependent helicase/nuclease subunit A